METSVMHKPFDFSRCLRRYGIPRNYRRKPIIACDTEQAGLGGEFLIGGYMRETDDQPTYFYSAEEWLDAIFDAKNYGYIWYAHNGGEYDFKYLIKPLRERFTNNKNASISVRMQGDRCIGFKIRYNHRNYELRDSYALMPSSLKKLSKTLAPEFEKEDIGLAEGVIFDRYNPVHMHYLHNDIVGLLHVILEFENIVWQVFHVPCAWTAPATALRAWRHMLSKDDRFWRVHRKAEEFFRKAYYGGLTFIRDVNPREDVTSVDFNSMYPSVMRDYGVPVGLPVGTIKYNPGYPGIYHVVAHIPDDFPFTMIPYRTTQGTLWPKGDFETYITSSEIEFAQQYGATFDIISGYVFDEERKIFSEFVNLCEQYRINYKGTGIEDVVKIMQNGLYGKFGSREEIATYIIREEVDDNDDKWTPFVDIDGSIVEGLYYKVEKLKAAYIQPHWAAWITARGRLRLAEAVYAIGPCHVIYGDTDSIYASSDALYKAIEQKALRTGKTYGCVKIEHHFKMFRAGGPKNYLGLLDDGSMLHKAKGMPRALINDDDHQRALNGEKVTVQYTGMNSMMSILKRGLDITSVRTRSYSQLENSAGWLRTSTGTVVPVTLREASG